MFDDNCYLVDELKVLHERLELLHAESRALSERISCVDTQIQQMLLRQSPPAMTFESAEGYDPPFHLVGA